MITLHESNITTFPMDNGIGVLRDVIRAYAEEELNGMFEFYMEYDSEGHLVDELKEERIIKAKAQDKLGYQLFRIYSITKHHENDNLIVRAQHITYDLADNFVEKLEANNLTKKQVMELIGSNTALPHPFNITSSNTTTRSSTKLYRTNPLQMIGGMEGSVLQIWGGQIERDNFNLILHDRRGSDDGVKVTYEKNITGLEATFDISGLVTRIFPFVYIEETDNEPARLITVSGKYIDSPHINDYEKIYIKPIDYSHDERIDTQDKTDAQIRQQLEQVASRYFEETGNDKIKVDMEVQFEHLWETEEYKDLAVLELVGMGDTVTVEHSRLKVDATAIVNYIRYDCIAEKNEEVRLGSVKARLTDSVNKVVDVAEKVEQAQQTANQAIRAANGKNTIYYGPDEPTNGIEGDLWFRVVDGEYTRTYRHDGIQWQLVLSVDVRDAMDEAQQAKDEAQSAVNRANQATQQATNAINQAQTAFDEAQQALGVANNALDVADDALNTASNATSIADSAFNKAQESFNKAQEALDGLVPIVEFVGEAENEFATIKGDIQGLQTTVSGKVDESVYTTFVQQTNQALATKITMQDAEGVFVKETTFTATIDGLQTRVSDNEGNISNLTQIAQGLQSQVSDIEGNVSTLQQTAQGLQSSVTNLQDELDGLEIGGRNLLLDSTFNEGKWERNLYTTILPPEPDKPNSSIMRLYSVNDTGNTNINHPIWNNNRIYLEPREGDKITFSFDFYCEDSSVAPAGTIATFRRFSDRTGGNYVQVVFNGNMDTYGIGGVYGRWVRAKYTYTFTSNTAVAGWYAFGVYMSNSVTSGSSETRVADYKYREIKIEHGDKATDWTPAPEDIDHQFSVITQTIDSITTRVGDAEGNITVLQQTSSSLAARLTSAEGNITTLTATVNGLQTTVSNIEGDVSSVTQLANALQVRMTNAEGDISTLTQTASSLQSTITEVRDNIGRWTKIYRVRTANPLNLTESDGSLLDDSYTYEVTAKVRGTSTQTTAVAIFRANSSGGSGGAGWTLEKIYEQGKTLNHPEFFIDENGRPSIRLYNHSSYYDVEVIHEKTIGRESVSTRTQSQITQLSDAINLRVMKGDVINQINISDESILIDGKRIHITGQTTIDDAVIKSAHIESLDGGKITAGSIDAGKLNVTSLSAISAHLGTVISGRIETLEIAGVNNPAIYFESKSNPKGLIDYNDNAMRFQRDLWTYYRVNEGGSTGSVGVNPKFLHQFYAAGEAIFNFGIVGSHTTLTSKNALLKFSSITNLVQVRDNYDNGFADLQADNLIANQLHSNEIRGTSGNLYLRPAAGGSVQAMTATGVYIPITASSVNANSVFTQNVEARNQDDVYVRPTNSGGLHVRSRGTGTPYRPVYASAFNQSSSRDYKTNIEKYNESALEVINDLTVVTYNLKDDLENGILEKKIGFISEDSPAIATADGKAIQTYQLSAYNTKAIQELDMKFTNLEDEVNWLKLENQYLKQKIEQLEEMIA